MLAAVGGSRASGAIRGLTFVSLSLLGELGAVDRALTREMGIANSAGLSGKDKLVNVVELNDDRGSDPDSE